MARTSGNQRFLARDFGTCLSFDGVGDYVEIDRSLITPWNGESTICFWARLKSKQPSDKPFIDCQWGDNNAGGWQILANASNQITAYVGDASGRDGQTNLGSLVPGKWHFISVTKKVSTTTQSVYLDGVLLGSITNCTKGTINPVTNRNLRFAGNRTGGTEMNVFMDDVQIYNTALTIAQIKDIYYNGKTQSGLIHRWKFDEASGTTALDSIGSANGTITNATYSTAVFMKARTVAGLRNGVVIFCDLNGNVLDTVNNVSATISGTSYDTGYFNGTQAINPGTGSTQPIKFVLPSTFKIAGSVSIWVKRTGTIGGTAGLWCDGDYSATSMMRVLSASNNQIACDFKDINGNTYSNVVGLLNDTNWHHLVVTWGGGKFSWYWDSVVKNGAGSAFGNSKKRTNTLIIGGDTYGGENFPGLFSNLIVWNRKITQAEVTRLFGLSTPPDKTLILGNITRNTA